jgi:dimethylaniline monooxygenase (N-oxide forming)
VYTDNVGKDKHGLDIHSSMYKGLHTNLPKEIMHYPDYPFMEQNKSYISQAEVLAYYQSYADTFNLRKYIKFEHHVVRVRPLLDRTWEVITRDLERDKYEIERFDGVLVCNGHYSTPLIPKFEGQDVFQGEQMHSHDFRCGERFKGEKFLMYL